MAASILTFPEAKEAQTQARERHIKGIAASLASFAKGERDPVTEDERALYNLAMCLKERCAALK